MNESANQNNTSNQMPGTAVAKLIDRVMSLTEEECSMVLAYLAKGDLNVLQEKDSRAEKRKQSVKSTA